MRKKQGTEVVGLEGGQEGNSEKVGKNLGSPGHSARGEGGGRLRKLPQGAKVSDLQGGVSWGRSLR